MARINHPKIVTVYSVGQYQELPYLVMEFVAGKSLDLLLAEEGRLEIGRAVGIACQVLDALEHAHAAGIVHRDIKPANILIEAETERVKLADFGLARCVADEARLTAAGSVLGTPWYMAPEQADGSGGLDPRQDLFSVGVVLFEMLVGTLPFPGKHPLEVLAKICMDPTPDPSHRNPPHCRVPCPRSSCVPSRKTEPGRLSVGHRVPVGPRRIPDEQRSNDPDVDRGASLDDDNEPGGRSNRVVRPRVAGALSESRTGLGGDCLKCGMALCSQCWKVAGSRHCRDHGGDSSGPRTGALARNEKRLAC